MLTVAAKGSLLNFVVTGDVRSGTAIIQSSLDHTPRTVCHANLLFAEANPENSDRIRREAHESYFGVSRDPVRLPEWFCPRQDANPHRYLTDHVFDRPCRGEDHIGVRLLYSHLAQYDMYDLLTDRWRDGDFCIVHVVRNPVVCLTSYKQAMHSGNWSRSASSTMPPSVPTAVTLDPQELTEFVRQHEAVKRKVRSSCPDCLEVTYKDLCLNYQPTMEKVFEFLELPAQRISQPTIRRLRNRDLSGRISNYTRLKAECGSDVRQYLESDLF